MRDKLLTDLQQAVPLSLTTLDLSSKGQTPGLVIVDIVNGFATVGAGKLAPQSENIQVNQMISEADRLGKAFKEQGFPILAFLDSHQPGKTEPPYPPHCEIGTGEEELVPDVNVSRSWMPDGMPTSYYLAGRTPVVIYLI